MHKHVHPKKLAHVGKASVAVEGAYHACEIAGIHSGVLVAAAALLLLLVIRAVTGVPMH